MEWKLRRDMSGNPLTDLHQSDFGQVSHLYDEQNPKELQTYVRRAADILPRFDSDHRESLVNALNAYMSSLGASTHSLKQLERLRDPKSLAVVTGQQAGLFTGPLYAVYKALSAIGLAKRLETQLNRPIVPVFWIASEDHDWAEVDHAYVLGHDDEVHRLRMDAAVPPHQMVYYQRVDAEAVERVLADANAMLPEGPEKSRVLTSIKEAFREGMTMAEWFARVLLEMVNTEGLILLDPCLPALRDLVRPVWINALSKHREVQVELDKVYGEIERLGFAPAVHRDETNTTVFHVIDGKRFVLEHTANGDLRTRGVDVMKSVAEWTSLAASDGSRFSSNVLLRPVVQDHLLPVLAYVGGPAEIAYHALSAAVFHVHERKLPPLLLRERLTLYPPSVQRNMQKWNIAADHVLRPVSLSEPVLNRLGALELERDFDAFAQSVEMRWSTWADKFSHLGPQIETMARAQIRREIKGIQRLERKSRNLFSDRHNTELRQVQHVERWLWTDGHAQERRLCPLNIWTRFGLDWLHDLPFWGDYQAPLGIYHVNL